MDYHFPLPKILHNIHGIYTQKQAHKNNFEDVNTDPQLSANFY